MNLFRKRKFDEDGYFLSGVAVDAVREDVATLVSVGDNDLMLVQVDGEVVAVSAECPHAAADLSQGTLHRGRITCPLHEWKFDLKTGRALWPEDEVCRLKRFPVRIVDGLVRVNSVS